jgi:Family of unknown function (DUF6399)
MSTVIDCAPHDHVDRHLRWDRYDRAERFSHDLELQAQGVSQRQAAQQLQVPRSTLQAWRTWHDTLDSCPHVAQFFQRGPGLAFLHRLVLALHLICVEVGACGIRLVCLFLKLTGLDRFVATSSGAQQQVNRQVEEAIVAYRQAETARLATDMPRKDLTLTPDETVTGGLCLVGSEPVSHCIILERLAQARDQVPWNALMAPALVELHCQVIQSTRDEAPGLLASVEHQLGAQHAPDLFQVQHELSKAVCAPMAAKVRAAHKVVTEAHQTLDQVQANLQTAGNEPPTIGAEHSPEASGRREHAWQALDMASGEHERLAQQREQVAKSIRAIGQAYHFVDLARGVRRNGQLIAHDIHAQMDQIRTIAQHEGLSQACLDRIEKAARVVPNMQATIAFVSGYVRQQVRQLDLTPPASYAMHAQLIPSYYLERVAQTRTVTAGEPLRALAERLRAPLFETAGALSQRNPEVPDHLHHKAQTLAEVFQRSSSNVEGRNGYVSLRNHQLRGLDLPRKRECLTAIHNFFLTRPDGTTAAERFFGQKPRSMFAAILESVELPPAPLSPPRRA